MYKVLSICLAFSLAMSEITTVKQNTFVDVTKDQANIKKPKSGEPIELNILNTENSNSFADTGNLKTWCYFSTAHFWNLQISMQKPLPSKEGIEKWNWTGVRGVHPTP